MFVCLFVCLFTFEVPFNGLFAPTSRSRMSNIFRDSESLGKSNGKKRCQVWTFLFGNGLKSPRNFFLFFFFADFALQNIVETMLPDGLETSVEGHIANFGISLDVFEFLCFGWFFFVFQNIWVFVYSWSTLLWYRCYYPHRSRDALSPVCGIFSQLFEVAR